MNLVFVCSCHHVAKTKIKVITKQKIRAFLALRQVATSLHGFIEVATQLDTTTGVVSNNSVKDIHTHTLSLEPASSKN